MMSRNCPQYLEANRITEELSDAWVLAVTNIKNIALGCSHAARNNHFAVFAQCFANGIERLLFGGVDKATGVYNHHVSVFVGRYNVVTVGTELSQNAFGVH